MVDMVGMVDMVAVVDMVDMVDIVDTGFPFGDWTYNFQWVWLANEWMYMKVTCVSA